jgi:hypothetical protein
MASGESFHGLTLAGRADGSEKGFHEPPETLGYNASGVPPLVPRLTILLRASPVDLAQVGSEIHAHPDLETLVMRLTESLSLSPDSAVDTPEEAAVVLGTDRLRVVGYMWSLLPQMREAADFPDIQPKSGAGPRTSSRASAEWTPEAMYLVSFLRWLGLDSPDLAISGKQPPCFASGLEGGELSVLAEILMRDFVSLIPILDPAILMPRKKPASTSGVTAGE